MRITLQWPAMAAAVVGSAELRAGERAAVAGWALAAASSEHPGCLPQDLCRLEKKNHYVDLTVGRDSCFDAFLFE